MIKVKNLNKYFYRHKSNEIHVLNDISLEFPETGLVTIFGESGCGKTTFMNVLGGLDNFSSGNIQIDDLSIKKYSSKKIDRIRNEKIGYIFQNYLLLTNNIIGGKMMDKIRERSEIPVADKEALRSAENEAADLRKQQEAVYSQYAQSNNLVKQLIV